MDAPRCHECNATARLNASGVCAWRSGCEHRQFISEAREAELERMLAAPVPAVRSSVVVDASGEPAVDLGPLVDLVVRHTEAMTREAHDRGLLPPDAVFQVPEIYLDDDL